MHTIAYSIYVAGICDMSRTPQAHDLSFIFIIIQLYSYKAQRIYHRSDIKFNERMQWTCWVLIVQSQNKMNLATRINS